ncbi:MAG TPA: PQQ-dependent sugar dehydrogenase [Verrucomicrobiae bacterium]|nr:PQQ-dependent sugar dehydrogenase [Verrucomicrobiae bacterium]
MQKKHHAPIAGAIHFSTLHVFAVTWLCVFELNAAGALLFQDDRWWDAGFDAKGLDGPAFAVTAVGTTVFVGGNFEYAGTVRARGLAKWNGTAWSRLGGGVAPAGSWVNTLATDGTNLFAAGWFSSVLQSGGAAVGATNIARWNGASWSNLRGGLDYGTQTLALGMGSLFAGGYFTNADGLGIRYLARWDGSNWSGLGLGVNGPVMKSAFVGDSLYVRGYFTSAGGVAATNFARWDGTNWWALEHSPFISVDALSVRGSDLLVAGGTRYQLNSPRWLSAVFRWTGTDWLPITTNIVGEVSAIASTTNAIYIGGDLSSIDGTAVSRIAMGNGCGWLSLGSGTDDPPSALIAVGDQLYAVGSFRVAGGKPSGHVARWNAGSLPWIEILDQQIVEGDAGHSFPVFTVRMCPAPASPVLVSYASSNGTAVANVDYAPVSGSILFTTESSFQAITVPVLGDRLYEPDENFYVVLNSTGRVVFAQTAATGTILNDDPLPSIRVSDAAVAEGDSGTNSMVFNVSLSSPHAETVLVDCRTSERSAKEWVDFLPVSARLAFQPGLTNQTVSVPILTDAFLEPTKDFTLQVFDSQPRLAMSKPEGVGLILNDDPVPVLSFTWPNLSPEVYVFEGDTSRTQQYVLTLSGPIDQTVSVDFATSDGTAIAGSDYLPAAGHLDFPPGVTTQSISVRILGDIYLEPEETFNIRLFNATNASLFSTQFVAHIYNDDFFELAPEFVISLVTTNLFLPTRMEFAPDGRLFVCEQAGALRIIKNGALLPEPFVTVPTGSNPETEAGLLGVTFDPGFLTNHYVYLFYTAVTPPNSTMADGRLRNRISRFTARDDQAEPGSELLLLETGDVQDSSFHNGGDLHFGPDGKLYASVGDNFRTQTNAQVLSNLFGKILRINPDGSIPADNPFDQVASGSNRAIWALGLRNPFSFSFEPGTGRMLINDVGDHSWEEINEGQSGANFGWPVLEGPGTNSSFRNPLYAYDHASTPSQLAAITAGVFYNPPERNFPAGYVGSYFFADFFGQIKTLTFTNGPASHLFASSGAIDLKVSPEGHLYSMDRYNFDKGRVWRFDNVAEHPSFRSIETLAGGEIELTLMVGSDRTYLLESSSDLTHWRALTTFHSSARTFVYRDAAPRLAPRFYRVKSE